MCNLLHVTRCNFLCNNCRLSDVMENIHDVPHHFCLTNRLFSITLKNLQSLHKKIAARCVQQLRMKPRHRAAFSFNARKSVHYGRCPVRCGVGISLLPPTASPWPIRPTHTHTHTLADPPCPRILASNQTPAETHYHPVLVSLPSSSITPRPNHAVD